MLVSYCGYYPLEISLDQTINLTETEPLQILAPIPNEIAPLQGVHM